MGMVYGWRYAHESQGGAGKRKNARRNVYVRTHRAGTAKPVVRQHYKAQRLAPPAMGVLNKNGRYVVALLLVLISLAVVGKEPLFKGRTWNNVTSWMKHWLVAAKPAPSQDRAATVNRTEAGAEVQSIAREKAKPLALIADQGLFLLDVKGQIWPLDHNQTVDILPVVTGVRVKEVPGAMGVMLTGQVNTAVVQALLAQPFSDQLSELHFGNHDLILYTRDGIKITIDPRRHLQKDLVRLQAVLGIIRAKAQKIASIDMRYDQQLVVRPVGRR